MAVGFSTTAIFMFIFIVSRSISTLGTLTPKGASNYNLSTSAAAIEAASTDYGHIVTQPPSAVLYPSSVQDILDLVKRTYKGQSTTSTVAARGCAHSVRGQAMAENGVVVDMTSMRRNGTGVVVSGDKSSGYYADVGGEMMWIEVLKATLEHGLAPRSWTDYLYLTAGGTLSNAGISGQTFRYGPQISNVYELDVITGKGEFLTCSRENNPELFYAVLGGLGQFGIITRARIVLQPAPTRVKWAKMLYSDFSAFTRDQERLISVHGGHDDDKNGLNYVEGSLLLEQGPDLSFFPPSDQPKIISLIKKYGIIYCLEVVKHYDNLTQHSIDKDFDAILRHLSFIREFRVEKNVSYMEFLDRVRSDELFLRSKGLWEVPHPWLNLFIPKSRIMDFHDGVLRGIILRRNLTTGLVLFYPMNKNKWDDGMSAVTPDEDVFYTLGILQASGFDDWEEFDDQNKDILEYCNEVGIKIKQYLPHYTTKEDWINHFGAKWETFRDRKVLFDPKLMLSPGQRIFNNN